MTTMAALLAAALCFLAATALAQCPSSPLKPGSQYIDINYGGLSREYLIHVPRTYNNTPLALVLAWHGRTNTPDSFSQRSRFSTLADQSGKFIVAYPAGVGESFNAGTCCTPATTRNVDDFGFARALVTDISKRVCVDSSRVYTTGYSNGCFMSQGLICKAPDVFSKSACGSGGEILTTPCIDDYSRFNLGVDVLEIHGTSDLTVPYNGNPLLGFPPVLENYAGNRKLLSCQTGPFETFNKGNYRCEEYRGCRDNTVVEQCTVTRGTHEWFDTADFSNSEYILDFFGL